MSDQHTVDGNDFVDFAAFYVALNAVDEILTQVPKEGGSTPDTLQGIDWIGLAAQREEATVLLRRVAMRFDSAMEVLLGSALEKANLRVKTRFLTSMKGNPITRYADRARFLTEILPRFNSHAGTIHEVLPQSHGKMMQVIRASASDNPVARLLAVSSVRPASGSNAILKKWQMSATSLCGNAVPSYEETATDMQTALDLTNQIQEVEIRLQGKDPAATEAVDLAEAKVIMQSQLSEVIAESVDPQAVSAAVAQKVSQERKFITKVAAAIDGGLTPAGEECVIQRGKAVIAAGAGSGKTRVLASKVVYHIQELGLSPSGIIAVSFSRKSAGELKHRVMDYAKAAGLSLDPKGYYPGMGTTHSIARMVLNQAGYKISASAGAPERERVVDGSEQVTLIKVAIEQVKMAGGKDSRIPKDAMTFFPYLRNAPVDDVVGGADGTSQKAIDTVSSNVVDPVQGPSPLTYYLEDKGRFKNMIETALRALTQAVVSVSISAIPKPTVRGPATLAVVSGPGIQQFYKILDGLNTSAGRLRFEKGQAQYRSVDRFMAWGPQGMNSTAFVNEIQDALGFTNIQNARKALSPMVSMDPATLTPDQLSVLEMIITQPLVASSLESLSKTASEIVTADDESDANANIEAVSKNQRRSLKENKKGPYYYWMNNSANQWFNLGAKEDDFLIKDSKGNKKEVPLTEFTGFIGRIKNSMIAPGQVFTTSVNDRGNLGEDIDEDGAKAEISPHIKAAVYGAYEWLKGNVQHLKGRLDYDDQLIQASRALTENPNLLKKFQRQYKCVLVDEAQDLNKCQHTLFGLIAGYLDSGTLKPRVSGNMAADTYAFIGDDKQAIYEFRGAEPDEFIRKSDLIEGGEGFKTHVLDTNYRSGSAVVESANRLIAYNTKQIPMVCQSHPPRGEGKVSRVQVDVAENGPGVLTSRILSDLEEARAAGTNLKGFYRNYGLAVRTNNEVHRYAMAMIEAGIPFRSKKNFFGGPLLGPVTSLFSLYDESTTIADRNECVIKGLRAPNFGISGRTLAEKLGMLNAGDYLEFLREEGNAEKIYPGMGFMTDKVKAYVKYLSDLEAMVKEGTSTSLLNFILEYRTPEGTNFAEQLAADVKNDNEEMEEAKLRAAEEGEAEVTAQMLIDQATKPLEPLRMVAAKYPKARDFVKYIDSLVIRNRRVNKTDSEDIDGEADVVTIDTVHGWKGLETKHLFVPMVQGSFPHFRTLGDEESLASERRLAYVAITRGRDTVTIIEPTKKVVGDKTIDLEPSQFATEACIQVEGKKPRVTRRDEDTTEFDSGTDGPERRASLLERYTLPIFDVHTASDSDEGVANDLIGQWGDLMGDFK